MMNTRHAYIRSQQRGIPPMIDQWLDLYGREEYAENGVVIVYLCKDSIRSLEKDLGKRPVSRMSEWFNAYKVRSTAGDTITVGFRRNRIKRK
jgi:hypothetical protein